jgi:hypothetical protein
LIGALQAKKSCGRGPKVMILRPLRPSRDAGDRHEVDHHLGDVGRRAHGVLGDVGRDVAHAQVVGAVEHAAVGIAAAAHQVAVALGGAHVHARAIEALGDEGLGGLGPEVAQEHAERVRAGVGGLLDGGQHIGLALDHPAHEDHVEAALAAGVDYRGAAALREVARKAVPAHGDEAEPHVGGRS